MKKLQYAILYSITAVSLAAACISCTSTDSSSRESEPAIQLKTANQWAEQDQDCVRIGESMLGAFNRKDYKSFIQYMLPEYHENLTEADFNDLWGSLGTFQE